MTTATGTAKLVLKKGEDRRVRGGHPWIFSNEVEEWLGDVTDGGLVDVSDHRGAFLGRAYVNRHSLISARLLTRGRDEIDTAFFVKRLERAKRLRDAVYPGERAVRLVYGESDQLPGLIVDRYGDHLVVQVLTLGMEQRLTELKAALQQVFEPQGAVLAADSPLRTLEGLDQRREVWWGDVPERLSLVVGGFGLEPTFCTGRNRACSWTSARTASAPRPAPRVASRWTCSATRASGPCTWPAVAPRACWPWIRPNPDWHWPARTSSGTDSPSASSSCAWTRSTRCGGWSARVSASASSSWTRPRSSSHAASWPPARVPTASTTGWR
jgi:hypothetical protein